MPAHQKEEMKNRAHPCGSVQGICTAATGLFALLIAFIGYTNFSNEALQHPWKLRHFTCLSLALIAAVALACVPWFATQPRLKGEEGASIDKARRFFAVGAASTFLAIASFFVIDIFDQSQSMP
jgi:hypothetical protein